MASLKVCNSASGSLTGGGVEESTILPGESCAGDDAHCTTIDRGLGELLQRIKKMTKCYQTNS